MRRLSLLLLLLPVFCFAQDFGFGFDDESTGAGESALPFTLKAGGSIEAGMLLYVYDFNGGEKAQGFHALDMLGANINFTAEGTSADVFVDLNLSSRSFEELRNGGPDAGHAPLLLNEAFVRAFLGSLNIEAGLIKLSWGRMFSPGPLDMANPLDYSDLTNLTDSRAMKIARPMLHLSLNTGDFTKIETVFIPNFQGHRFAQSGRWVPSQFSDMEGVISGGILDRALESFPASYASQIINMFNNVKNNYPSPAPQMPDTSGLDYFQSGLRFTTTIGAADMGAQYFYGNMFRPSVYAAGVDKFLENMVSSYMQGLPFDPGSMDLTRIEYNRYHQLGIDWAQVIGGFNARAEFAYHITDDFSGDDGAVKNPFIAWSFGFDRDIIWDINVNIQCNETIRIFNNKINKNPAMDCEGGTDFTSTRLIMQVSKQFFREKLDCKLISIWGIEDNDCHIVPSVAWTINDVRAEASAGIFAGSGKGELGQYLENSFVRLAVKYSF
ncbi:MAG: hypothetical protein FWG99_00705 [Treponema sp.]|nr:hypothetical protein [Treponema sp.]